MPHRDSLVGSSRAARRFATALGVAALCLAGASSAWAGKVYRCGNTFQDQPCAESKPVDTRPAERPAVAREVVADCDVVAKGAAGRSECASTKLARESARAGSTRVKP